MKTIYITFTFLVWIILTFLLFPQAFTGNFYEEQKLKMECMLVNDKATGYMERCENFEAICYRFHVSAGASLQCKFKNNN
jgi:hypothetical protein